MEDLKFECDAHGCAEKVEREFGLCKDHFRRYVESKRPGAPVFLRKSQNCGGPKKAPFDPLTLRQAQGSGREEGGKEAGMKCSRCERSSGEVRKFIKKRGLCISCCMTIAKAKREGKKPPPIKGKKKDAGEGEGTASLKTGKIYGHKKEPLTPALSPKERGRKKKTLIDSSTGSGRTAKTPGRLDTLLTLDFSDYGNLYGIIAAKAQEEFRTPEMQALFIIKEALK